MTSPADQATPAGIEVRSVTKRFDSVVALDAVDLSIPSGSFFGLLGPSGCGKTTLLRVIAGLEQPDEGTVVLGGVDITRHPPERRPFNIVFQRYALFPHLSVHDNIAFGLTTQRSSRPPVAEIATSVREMLKLVGLEGYDERRPRQLSGGQQQRVAVARALIRRPQLLLLDEPLAALDRNVRHAMREELLRIHSETGTTFLLVTHDQDEALSMSDQVALMADGRFEQVADPGTLYREPATQFAAQFVGAGTLLTVRAMSSGGGRVEVELAGRRFSAVDAGAVVGADARVLLRPEELKIVAAGEGVTAGTVTTRAFFGSNYELRVDTPSGIFRILTPEALDPGVEVALGWSGRAGIAYPAPE